MSIDKKPEDQVTEAGAVELDETQLDEAAGGLTTVLTTPPDPVLGAINPPDPVRETTVKLRGY